jgi:hypothetical protein
MMEELQNMPDTLSWVLAFSIPVIFVWSLTWKIIGMWKAGRNNHLAWFLCIALINTLGILPIIYILMNRKKAENATLEG